MLEFAGQVMFRVVGKFPGSAMTEKSGCSDNSREWWILEELIDKATSHSLLA